jgi:hypothetical protein
MIRPRRVVPTPGSTTATITASSGKYENARASTKLAASMSCAGISWARSMTDEAGEPEASTARITPA